MVRTIKIGSKSLASVAVSPDECYAAGASNAIYLCDLARGFNVRRLLTSEHTVESLAFSPASDMIAAGSRYADVRLVTLSGDVARSIPCGARVESLEFQPDSSELLIPNRIPFADGTNSCLQLWKGDLSQRFKEFTCPAPTPSGMTLGRFSPNDGIVAAGRRYSANVLLFDKAASRIMAETPEYRASLNDVSFSPTGRQLAVAYRNGSVQLFELQGQQANCTVSASPKTFRAHAGEVSSVRFIAESMLATSGADGVIRVWNTSSEGNDASQLVDSSWSAAMPFAWNPSPSKAPLKGLELSPDGSRLVYLGEKSTSLYDVRSGNLMERYAARAGDCAAWSPAGDKIALCRPGKTKVEVIDQRKKPLFCVEMDDVAHGVAFSPVANLMAVISDKCMRLARANDGANLFDFPLKGRGESICFSRDGKQLSFGGHFQGVVLFDPTTRQVVRELHGGRDACCAAFNSNGSLLAVGDGDGVIRMWDTNTGRLLHELSGHDGPVHKVAFAPDDETFVSSSRDRTIRLWSVSLGVSYGFLKSNYAACPFSFSADGRHFAIGRQDQLHDPKVLLWHANDPNHKGQLQSPTDGHNALSTL
jgi:WD40 repeat protein